MMKKFAFVVLLGVIGNAHATLYTYSLRDAQNNLISGAFEGTASGNLITDISNISLKLNGEDVSGGHVFTALTYNEDTHHWEYGSVLSFNGAKNNFLFINSDYIAGDYSYDAFLNSISIESVSENYFLHRPSSVYSSMLGAPAAYNWTVSAVNEVPEPASFGLISLGLAGLGAIYRRKK